MEHFPPAAAEPLPELDPAAFHGLAGRIVETVAPHTEADPVALLTHFLVMASNAIGRVPHYRVESTRHGMNLFAVLVGPTSHGRKGIAAGHVHNILEKASSDWENHWIVHGPSSGEGVIWAVRDPIKGMVKTAAGGLPTNNQALFSGAVTPPGTQ